jgi:hypothetical protein
MSENIRKAQHTIISPKLILIMFTVMLFLVIISVSCLGHIEISWYQIVRIIALNPSSYRFIRFRDISCKKIISIPTLYTLLHQP